MVCARHETTRRRAGKHRVALLANKNLRRADAGLLSGKKVFCATALTVLKPATAVDGIHPTGAWSTNPTRATIHHELNSPHKQWTTKGENFKYSQHRQKHYDTCVLKP